MNVRNPRPPLAGLIALSLAAACAVELPNQDEAADQATISAGAVPIYELYSDSSTDHFYTVSEATRDLAISYGFAYAGVPFYVEGSAVAGTSAFQRFYAGWPLTDHFYTTDPNEIGYVLSNGWVAEGIEGHIYQTGAAGTVPLYRLNRVSGGDVDHLYTIDASVVYWKQSQGWTLDGIEGFVWPIPPPTPHGVFLPIQEPVCLDGSTFPGWTVGGQYVDGDNGVPTDQYSMLARWQGADLVENWVSYRMGDFTGLDTYYQRGKQPQDVNGSPGVQISCSSFGMLINTWYTPHRPVVGGGYNDMYGYRWSAANRPRAFVDPASGSLTHLVVQANLAVAEYRAFPNHSQQSSSIAGQLSLFVYLSDTTHPWLHPIAIVAGVALSNWNQAYLDQGGVSYDYAGADTAEAVAAFPNWFAPGQTGDGVWFASGPISSRSTNPYVTTIYSAGNDDAVLPEKQDRATPAQFWRAHITPANLQNTINAINGAPDCSARGCPGRGYSTNPADYVLDYAGVILEVALVRDTFDVSPTSWVAQDGSKDQVSMGIHGDSLGLYRYLP